MRKQKMSLTEQKIPPKQHQDFDKILKKTFARIYESLIQKLLKLDLTTTVKISTTFSRTKEKRIDFAVKVTPTDGKEYIVHVEFQGRPGAKMDSRQLGYYNDIYSEFGLEVIQYVIYMGSGEPNMKTEIRHKNLDFSYEIIVLNQIDVEIFLNSEHPHEIVLAILCKYDKKSAPKIIKEILEKLRSKAKSDQELFEYTTDLEILSELRKLQSETKKQVNKMPIIYDLTKDLRYKEGKIEGKLEGKLEGMLQGEQTGELKKARIGVIHLLKEDTFSIERIAYIMDVAIEFVREIQKELKRNPDLKA